MNIHSKVAMPRSLRPASRQGEYPNYFASYQREREYSKRLERLLSRAVALLEMETHRRELAGEDVTGMRDFIREAKS